MKAQLHLHHRNRRILRQLQVHLSVKHHLMLTNLDQIILNRNLHPVNIHQHNEIHHVIIMIYRENVQHQYHRMINERNFQATILAVQIEIRMNEEIHRPVILAHQHDRIHIEAAKN